MSGGEVALLPCPCPMCGSDAVLDDLGDPQDDSFVHCDDCGLQQIAKYTPMQAIAAWNTRTPIPLAAASDQTAIHKLLLDIDMFLHDLHASSEYRDTAEALHTRLHDVSFGMAQSDNPAAASEVVREAVEAALLTMRHARVFIGSRQKMHPDGQALYDADVEVLSAALASLSPAQPEVEPVIASARDRDAVQKPQANSNTATHNAQALVEALQTIASAEFVDVMCDPGWAIRIARSALDSAEVKS